MLYINKISQPYELDTAISIRKMVFVSEQKVPEDMEQDEFDATATHYLALDDGNPCGTARWRPTSDGVKLERFAVLKSFRKKGVGAALVQVVLMDVRGFFTNHKVDQVYLHAQIDAIPFYEKFGFKKTGPSFDECGIQHYKMVLDKN